ncbi:hypothetical protein GCM10007205_03850 [Oxalicibacterium flavum]|uniref:TadE-like domain-containing protein n=1 Tax=Oxalicibacterium flavum TaxID=179467 RepID=A0A8J2UL51_9BURK|nr:TadE family protein [Oxalicibacterium flavum]GGB97797.1 hypothetical protein GCM10007205_03850 [Oxalicibacterium flavum]
MQAKYRKPTTATCKVKALSCLSLHTRLLENRFRIRRQQGASAIEFALVFPLFFLIFYAIITYGLILVAQQSVTLAAAEGARAALRHAEAENIRDDHAEAAAKGPASVAAWLGLNNLDVTKTLLDPCPYTNSARCYSVTVSYPYAERPLVPLLLGPLMEFAVPTQLSSTAIVQLD